MRFTLSVTAAKVAGHTFSKEEDLSYVRRLGGKSADERTRERLDIAARSIARSASMLDRHELGEAGVLKSGQEEGRPNVLTL